MRWFRIRRAATLDPELRETFEQYGVISMYDKAERRETWSLTMEVAITVLVAAELVLLLLKR